MPESLPPRWVLLLAACFVAEMARIELSSVGHSGTRMISGTTRCILKTHCDSDRACSVQEYYAHRYDTVVRFGDVPYSLFLNHCVHGLLNGGGRPIPDVYCSRRTHALPQFASDGIDRLRSTGARRLNYTSCIPDEPIWRWPPLHFHLILALRNPVDVIPGWYSMEGASVPQQPFMQIFRFVYYRQLFHHSTARGSAMELAIISYEEVLRSNASVRRTLWRQMLQPWMSDLQWNATLLDRCISENSPPPLSDPSRRRANLAASEITKLQQWVWKLLPATPDIRTELLSYWKPHIGENEARALALSDDDFSILARAKH